MLRVSHNTCHLASSFNATASVTGRYTCPQNLLDHRNESFKIHYTTGRLLPIKDQCLDSYDNKDLKITKSKTSEQYFRDKFVIFIRLFDEHFARHFGSHGTRDVTSYWQADWTTDFLGDTFPQITPAEHTIPCRASCAIILGHFEARFQTFR